MQLLDTSFSQDCGVSSREEWDIHAELGQVALSSWPVRWVSIAASSTRAKAITASNSKKTEKGAKLSLVLSFSPLLR
jgi:hypothetical protein